MANDTLERDDVREREEEATPANSSQRGGEDSVPMVGRTESQASMPWQYSSGSVAGAGNKARAFLKKHKRKVAVTGFAGGAILPLIVIGFFILSGLKIPNFFQNIAAIRLTKLSRMLNKSLTNVNEEYTGFASLDDSAYQRAKDRYKQTVDKVDKYRPNKMLKNLERDGWLKYNYEKTALGRDRLVSIEITPTDNTTIKRTYPVPRGKFDRLLSPLRSFDQQRAVTQATNAALKLYEPKMPALVRAAAVKGVVKKSGGSLKGWVASKFIGKDDTQARVVAQQQSYEQVNNPKGVEGLSSEENRKAAQAANDAEKKCVSDAKCMETSVKEVNGGIPKEVQKVYLESFSEAKYVSASSALKKVVKFSSDIYAIALPICMIYDGSKISKEQLDSSSSSMQKAFFMTGAESDHLQSGEKYDTQEANALNWKLGNVQDSNAMRIANGQKPNTTEDIGGQRTAFGNFDSVSIIDAIFGATKTGRSGSTAAAVGVSPVWGAVLGASGDPDPLSTELDKLCPILTNVWFAAGAALVTAALGLITGGGSKLAEKGIGKLISEGLTKAVEKTAERIFTRQLAKDAGRVLWKGAVKGLKATPRATVKSKDFLWRTAKTGALIAASIYLARWITAQYAGTLHSGLETGTSFADNVDNGANQFSNDSARARFAARPLTNAEALADHMADFAYLREANQYKSPFQRYFALNNPQSLSARLGFSTMSMVNHSSFAAVFTSIGKLFNPAGLSSKLFGSINMQAAYAAGDVDLQDYGNVQFGYSKEEENKMDEFTYKSPAENSHALDEALKSRKKEVSEIDSKYGKCFSDSVGTLIKDGSIKRSLENGDVVNTPDILCSPVNLSFNNPEWGDLVFRWRLEKNYNKTQDDLLGMQDPAEPGSGGGSSDGGVVDCGDAKACAQKIVDNPNISWIDGKAAIKQIAATGHARDCGAPAVDPRILQVILGLATKGYKFTINNIVDGHGCDGLNHPKGKATDINAITGPGGNSPSGNPDKGIQEDIAKILEAAGGGGMGQADCTGHPQGQQGKINWFADSCNHQHVDVGDYGGKK